MLLERSHLPQSCHHHVLLLYVNLQHGPKLACVTAEAARDVLIPALHSMMLHVR